MNPTAEQQRAIDLFLTGKPLAIEAGAGTGKTSTLVMLAKAAPQRRGQYVAFNRQIVMDATLKMPTNVTCNTAHSLAYRAMMTDAFKARLAQPRARWADVATKLRMTSLDITTDGKTKTMAAGFLAGKVLKAIEIFCQTGDSAPDTKHVAYLDGIDLPDEATGRRTYANNDRLRSHLRPYLTRAWADLTDPHGTLPYTHGCYLKAWQLTHPRIAADFILFDEAQDANPVMLAIMADQVHAQMVYVGDSQQQIYEFTGAINALSDLPVEQKAYLSQSFRFGQPIADIANVVLGHLKAELHLSGWDQATSTVEAVAEPKAYLTRTNATAVRHLLACITTGRKAHLVGGGTEVMTFAKAAVDLQAGRPTYHPDLAMFDSWGEVVAYATTDDEGADLRLLVNLIEEFGAAAILDALQHMPAAKDADVVISTAHKSKGLEWESVTLAGDFNTFLTGRDGNKVPKPAELRLLYVALTRARERLDVTSIRLLGGDEDYKVEVEPVAVAPAGPSAQDVATAVKQFEAEMAHPATQAALVAVVENDAPSAANNYGITNVDGLGVVAEKLKAAKRARRAAVVPVAANQPVTRPSSHEDSQPPMCPECKYRRGHAPECSQRAAYFASLGAS